MTQEQVTEHRDAFTRAVTEILGLSLAEVAAGSVHVDVAHEQVTWTHVGGGFLPGEVVELATGEYPLLAVSVAGGTITAEQWERLVRVDADYRAWFRPPGQRGN